MEWKTVRVKLPTTVGFESSTQGNRSFNASILPRWERRASFWDTPSFIFSIQPLIGNKEDCQKNCTYKQLNINIASGMSWIFKGGL